MTHPLVPIIDNSIATDATLTPQPITFADETRIWRVGIVGLGSQGLYQLERLKLSANVRAVVAYDPDPQRLRVASGLECIHAADLASVIEATDTDAVFLTQQQDEATAKAVLSGGRHLVVDRPWMMSYEELLSVQELASASHRIATYFCLRRWSADFLIASAALQSGRLGNLRSIRFSSCVRRVPGDHGTAGVLRKFGFDLFDQLLTLVSSPPQSVFAKFDFDGQQVNEKGFLAVIEFEDGCTARFDIDLQSRLGSHTGWMLEGTEGSYRGGRLYTETVDGEIVDEPIQRPMSNADPFLSELRATWQEQSTTLPTLADAARIVELINAIERSAETGDVFWY